MKRTLSVIEVLLYTTFSYSHSSDFFTEGLHILMKRLLILYERANIRFKRLLILYERANIRFKRLLILYERAKRLMIFL